MQIVHIDTGEKMQGGQWQVLYLLRGLRARGHEQYLFAQGELAEHALAENFPVLKGRRLPPSQIVHVHDAHAHTRATLWARAPVVVSRRVGFPPQRGLLSRWKYRQAAHYIAVSKYVATTLEAVGVNPETISVVYDGVPIPQFFEPALDGPVVGMMKDSEAKTLVSAARAAGVEMWPVGDLVADLRRARALAYITRMQGLGSGAIAAMTRGVPVIASRVGGLPEVVEHERTGLLVANDAGEIGAALQRLAGDRELAVRFGRAGYERAAEKFSDTRMVESTEKIYRRVLK